MRRIVRENLLVNRAVIHADRQIDLLLAGDYSLGRLERAGIDICLAELRRGVQFQGLALQILFNQRRIALIVGAIAVKIPGDYLEA